MPQVTFYPDDELLEWLDSQAAIANRSRAKQISYILKEVQRSSHQKRYEVSSLKLCSNGVHQFKADKPMMADFCNCGIFMFGEVQR